MSKQADKTIKRVLLAFLAGWLSVAAVLGGIFFLVPRHAKRPSAGYYVAPSDDDSSWNDDWDDNYDWSSDSDWDRGWDDWDSDW